MDRRGKEPNKYEVALENLLATAGSDQARTSTLMSVIHVAAKLTREEYGTAEALRILGIAVDSMNELPVLPPSGRLPPNG